MEPTERKQRRTENETVAVFILLYCFVFLIKAEIDLKLLPFSISSDQAIRHFPCQVSLHTKILFLQSCSSALDQLIK